MELAAEAAAEAFAAFLEESAETKSAAIDEAFDGVYEDCAAAPEREQVA